VAILQDNDPPSIVEYPFFVGSGERAPKWSGFMQAIRGVTLTAALPSTLYGGRAATIYRWTCPGTGAKTGTLIGSG